MLVDYLVGLVDYLLRLVDYLLRLVDSRSVSVWVNVVIKKKKKKA